MTNEQKLAAITRGVPGSYDLAPHDGAGVELDMFQGVASRAHEIAVTRGYFRRVELIQEGEIQVFGALLVDVRSEAPYARQSAALACPLRPSI